MEPGWAGAVETLILKVLGLEMQAELLATTEIVPP